MIYIVLLAYNEEPSLGDLLLDLNRHLQKQPEPFRFIVVDDGSQDGTARAAEALSASLPLSLLRHPSNLGVAKAFHTGLTYVSGVASESDFVVTMEADKTNDPSCVPALIQKLKDGFDVACASRYQPGGAYVGFPPKRLVFSLGANLLARWLLRVPGVKDYTIFFRAYRVQAIRRAMLRYGERFIQCRGFASNAEILVKVVRSGAQRCAEIPTIYRYDLKPGKSKMKVLVNMREYFLFFWRTFAKR